MEKAFEYLDSDLIFRGTKISDVTSIHPTPFFIALSDVAENKLSRIKKLVDKHKSMLDVYVSVKTNDNEKWLQRCVEYGLGLEVVSEDELLHVRGIKSDYTKTIVNGPGWSKESISSLLDCNVDVINIDSLSQARYVAMAFEERDRHVEVGIRLCLNPAGHWNKFGIIPQSTEWYKVLTVIKESPYLHFRGLHFHEPQTMESFDSFNSCLQRISCLANDLTLEGFEIDWIDMGGGLEPSYFDHKNIDKLDGYLDYSKDILNGRRIIVELGKSLINDVFLCVTKCVSRKERNGIVYYFFDAGVNATGGGHANMTHDILLTMKEYESTAKDNDTVKAQLHGPMCFPSDMICSSTTMPKKFKEEDVLIIPYSGAYTLTLRWKGIIKNPPVIWV